MWRWGCKCDLSMRDACCFWQTVSTRMFIRGTIIQACHLTGAPNAAATIAQCTDHRPEPRPKYTTLYSCCRCMGNYYRMRTTSTMYSVALESYVFRFLDFNFNLIHVLDQKFDRRLGSIRRWSKNSFARVCMRRDGKNEVATNDICPKAFFFF